MAVRLEIIEAPADVADRDASLRAVEIRLDRSVAAGVEVPRAGQADGRAAGEVQGGEGVILHLTGAGREPLSAGEQA